MRYAGMPGPNTISLYLEADQFPQILPKTQLFSGAKTHLESHKVILHLPNGFSWHVFLVCTREQGIIRSRGFFSLALLSEFSLSLFLRDQTRRSVTGPEKVQYNL